MQRLVLVAVALLAVVTAKPQYVEWFEIKPAEFVPENSVRTSLKAQTSFSPYLDEWESFKGKHNKKYGSQEEENGRFEIFRQNVDYIEKHNIKFNNGMKSYYLGINQFADLTGSLEGQHFRKTKKLRSLSEQQLVDCSGKFGNEGCNGGLMDQAFEYVIKEGGIESETEYPYDAKQEKCRFHKSEVVATCTGCVDVKSDSEDDLKNAVGEVGPVSVAIDASHQSFQLYKAGVYNEPDCSSTELDHGVLTVGYGTDNGQDYWLVKNSWGTTWGEEGYVKMTRNSDNQCGIATQASYPLV